MPRRRKARPAVVGPKATIQLTVTAFHGIKDFSDPARFCVIADPVISDDAGGLVSQLPGDLRTIRVKKDPAGNPVHLEFEILPKRTYLAAGVIVNRGGLDDPGVDRENFKLGKVKKNKLILSDQYTVGPYYWELMIAIEKISSGAIGIIDPGVENSETA